MSELLQNTTPLLEVEEAAYLASMKELLKQIKIRFDNDPRQYTKRDYYYLIQYLCQNLNYLDEADLANVLNALDSRIDNNVTRINELQDEIDAIEHTVVEDIDGGDFITVKEINHGSHKNYSIRAEVVKGDSGNTGLTTDGYVKQLIQELQNSVIQTVDSPNSTLQITQNGNNANIDIVWSEF